MEPNETGSNSFTKEPECNGNTESSNHIVISARTGKPKRRKALRACTNCQRTHLTCDNNRPCERCVRRGCADTCVDGVRKHPKAARQPRPLKKTHSGTSLNASSVGTVQSPLPGGPRTSHSHHQSKPTLEVYEQNYYTQEPAPIIPGCYEQGLVGTPYAYPNNNAHFGSGYSDETNYHHHHPQVLSGQIEKSIPGSYEYGVYHNENEYSDRMRVSSDFPSTRAGESSPQHYESNIPAEAIPPYMPDAYQQSLQHNYSDVSPYGISPSNPEYINMAYKQYQHGPHQNSHSSLPDLNQKIGNRINPQSLFKQTDESVKESSEDDQSIISSMLHDSRKSSLASTKAADSNKGYRVDSNSIEYPSSVGIHSKQPSAIDGIYGLSDVPPIKNLDDHDEPDWLEIQLNPFTSTHDEKSGRFNVESVSSLENGSGQDVVRPFPYLESLRAHYGLLRSRLLPQEMDAAKEIVSRLMSIGLRITRIMSSDDQIFVEQCFQRSVQEKQKQFSHAPTACMIWRRTGDIVAVSPSFCRLTGWTSQQLVSEFVTILMDNEGILNYLKCLEMIYTSQNHNFRFSCQIGTIERKIISTEVEISVQKDLYNLPLIIFGKFWTYQP